MKTHSRVEFHYELDGILNGKKSIIWAIRRKPSKTFVGLSSWNKDMGQYTFDPDTDVHLSDKDTMELSKFLTDLNFVHNNMEQKERLKKSQCVTDYDPEDD